MDGQPVGSSAGGEQPKFTVSIERAGEVLNVLVKFSPPIDSIEGRRWTDLLVCEQIALQLVQEKGVPAVKTALLESEGRVFLEVVRFDRVGRFGRLPMISLRAIDNELYGRQDNWVAAAKKMEADNRMSREDARNLWWALGLRGPDRQHGPAFWQPFSGGRGGALQPVTCLRHAPHVIPSHGRRGAGESLQAAGVLHVCYRRMGLRAGRCYCFLGDGEGGPADFTGFQADLPGQP